MATMTIGRMNIGGTGKVYYAFTQGSPNRYRVEGATIEDQMDTLQRMGNQMISGPAEFPADLGTYVDLGEFAVEDVYNELFVITNQMMMDGRIIFVAADEGADVLAEVLMAVGDALLSAL